MNRENGACYDQKQDNFTAFCLENEAGYQRWRVAKLAASCLDVDAMSINMRNLSQPDDLAVSQIKAQIAKTNMAFYQLQEEPAHDSQINGVNANLRLRAELKQFCSRLGLHDTEVNRSQGDDGVVAIRIDNQGIGAGYIPYTNKPLSWHTDGYYNAKDARVRAMVLHCVRDASEGGANELLDPELVYLRLRDENPAYIEALMHSEAMIIPENTDKRSAYRPASIGPVFYLDSETRALNMRYSARSRNIEWRDDDITAKARAMLTQLLRDEPFIKRHKLKPGQGIISNNVLHNRTGFSDTDNAALAGRLLYRIRYQQRVSPVTGS